MDLASSSLTLRAAADLAVDQIADGVAALDLHAKDRGKVTTSAKTSCVEIVPAPVATPSTFPDNFKKKFGPGGEALAYALKMFSLDLVSIVAGYAVEYTEKDLGIREELERAGSFAKISPEARSRYQVMGPSVTTLNLFDQEVYYFEASTERFAKLGPYRVNAEVLKWISECFPNLQSLKMVYDADVIPELPKLLPQLHHLELRDYAHKLAFETIESISKIPLKSFTLRSVLYNMDIVKDFPPLSELTELGLNVCLNDELITFLQRRFPNIKRLRVSTLPREDHAVTVSKLPELPLEVLCIEVKFRPGQYERHAAESYSKLKYPKTLHTLIFHDSSDVRFRQYDLDIDYEKIRLANPTIKVIVIDSKTETPEKVKEVLDRKSVV
jgi:hypothetical protein